MNRTQNTGRILGILSGFLGILSVLSVLCFLFPDFLVSKDLRPIYAANLEVFRTILKSIILLTFAFGTLGAILLGLVSLLMGGWSVEIVSSGSKEVTLGLDYFVLELLVLELLVLGLIFIPMERLWRLRDFRILREGWQTDLVYFFTSHVGIQLFSFAALIPVQLALG